LLVSGEYDIADLPLELPL